MSALLSLWLLPLLLLVRSALLPLPEEALAAAVPSVSAAVAAAAALILRFRAVFHSAADGTINRPTPAAIATPTTA